MLRLLAALVVLGVAALSGLLLWPQLIGLEQTAGFAQIVSLRGAAASAALVAALVLALLALLARPARRFLGALSLVLLAFVGGTALILGSRGVGGPGFEIASPGDVTVLAWNTLGEAVTTEEVARLAIENGADIVSLPETTAAFADEVARIARAEGLPLVAATTAYDEVAKARSTSLLISESLGAYDISPDGITEVLPSVLATSSDGGPVIVAVHAVAPVPGELGSWRSDLAALAALCSSPDIILAGDFNATLDAFAELGTDAGPSGATTDLGLCSDAARLSGAAAVGTWPAAVPPLLGAPIDHVMVGAGWRVSGFRVILDQDGAGSDHRPVLAQLSPAS